MAMFFMLRKYELSGFIEPFNIADYKLNPAGDADVLRVLGVIL